MLASPQLLHVVFHLDRVLKKRVRELPCSLHGSVSYKLRPFSPTTIASAEFVLFFFLLLNFKGALYLAGDETREPVRRKVGRLMLMTTVEQLVRAQGGDAP